ncbi:MAG: L-glutamate gamma-semialdehyde dehydrogenase [Deltaproteobacteria bacterium]|nr:L-glutamate gamma-semialdehyde dehydrogenase [Deltaproteobacteria bacterium]
MSKSDKLEALIETRGAELFEATRGVEPSIFDKGYWNGKIIDYCMAHKSFKVEMFRFVDVLPTLRDAKAVARHIDEYFNREDLDLPAAVKTAVVGATAFGGFGAKMASGTIEKNVSDMARRFLVGANPDEALPTLARLREQNICFTVDLLGEAAVSEKESHRYLERYLEILDVLNRAKESWPDNDLIDQGTFGPLPKANLSIKVSSFYSQMDPIAYQKSLDILKERLRPLLLRARQTGAFINFDLEQFCFRDLIYDLFMQLCDEPDLRDYPNFGVVVQAYLRDSQNDARRLISWVKRRRTPVTVRLVKGAYWDYETILAKQRGWPCPVFTRKEDTDANFELISCMLLDAFPRLCVAFGTHNIRSIAHAIAYAQLKSIPNHAVEMQSLYGMAEPIRAATIRCGYRQRVYAPIGELLPGMAYLVRRLLENTSNEGFMRRRFVNRVPIEKLLEKPSVSSDSGNAVRASGSGGIDTPFRNEPVFDYAKKDKRQAMQEALSAIQRRFGRELPIVVDGKRILTGNIRGRTNPSRSDQIIAYQHQAGTNEAEAAIRAARGFFTNWRNTSYRERSEILVRAASVMRARRHDLNALLTYEAGKPWREADADVCEAIDFLEYYAREVVRVSEPRKMQPYIPGEENYLLYEPRGVAVVIAPWNFPLAILCGMTSAALGSGNCVLIKPAHQTSTIGYEFYEILRQAGVPAGAIHFVPGPGYQVGQFLVDHPETDLVAFTGSMEVGRRLIQSAAIVHSGQRNIKAVICEMGGKNAVIVDDDADLDEAVKGIVYSAFGYAGQKCSACSRVIILDSCYDLFAERLVEATRSIKVGAAADPATFVPPVIDEDAQSSIRRYIDIGREQGEVLLEIEASEEGAFVGPVIIGNVDRSAVVAQEEIFGPVLCLMRAKSFDEAIDIALDSRYGLTGGLYSRSPEHIERARRDFRVGNLYINRHNTGALVERHPFGGSRMSGVGSKAGGPDYIVRFMEPRSISENTMRRGFAPEGEPTAD